jgi:hypothetical protein
MKRFDMRGFLRPGVAVAAVAIGAGELHGGRGVHWFDALMTRQASDAFRISLGLRLAHERRKLRRRLRADADHGQRDGENSGENDRYPFHQKVRITFVKT